MKAVDKGLLKTFSKMGISTTQSYRGAQIFEAIGLSQEVIDKYFSWTPSRVAGVGLEAIARETGVNVNTLLSRKRYAVLRLRERLKTIYDEMTKHEDRT